MIAVKAEQDRLEVTIPTDGMTPEDVNEFIAWLRVESIARRSQLTPDSAWQLAEDLKSDWWRANENRFIPQGT